MHSEWIFNQIESLNINKKINLLDFASGDGRNCIPLSKKNINVTAIDIDQEKLNKYKSFKNIIVSNMSILKSFKKNNIQVNKFMYLFYRLMPKVIQRLKKIDTQQ